MIELDSGKRIAKIRIEAGETQEETALAIGEKRENIRNWESGTRALKAETIIKLAQHFNVSADYLLGLSDVPTNDKDFAFVCNYTGLSERAVGMLELVQKLPEHSEAINSLLCESTLWMSKYLHEIQKCTDDLKSKISAGIKKEASDAVADAAAQLELALFRFSRGCDTLPEDLYGALSALEKAEEYPDLVILNDPETLSREIDAPLETALSILADGPITSIADFQERLKKRRRQHGQHTED